MTATLWRGGAGRNAPLGELIRPHCVEGAHRTGNSWRAHRETIALFSPLTAATRAIGGSAEARSRWRHGRRPPLTLSSIRDPGRALGIRQKSAPNDPPALLIFHLSRHPGAMCRGRECCWGRMC
jgi:hypothetical protein